ncbi:MAG: hypothetical protein AB7U45_15375 [Desulfamplus sp.]
MLLNIKPKYFYDQQGKPKTVMLSHKYFTRLQEIIEDFEDKIDLLKAEKEALRAFPWLTTKSSYNKEFCP